MALSPGLGSPVHTSVSGSVCPPKCPSSIVLLTVPCDTVLFRENIARLVAGPREKDFSVAIAHL